MEEVKVSVIVPAYNASQYLRRCLDSIVNQTLKDIEIIIINDGSTDNTEEIIKSYNDDRIVYVYQKNSGLSVSRNNGMSIAKGKYIAFVDSDDWISLDFIEKLYTAAEKYSADVSVAGIIRLHTTNKKYHLKFEKESVTEDVNEKFRLCDIPERSYVWNKLYRLDNLRNNNLEFEEGRIYEDVVFTPQVMVNSNKLVTVCDTYYYYWRHSGSLVTKQSKKAKEDYDYMHKKADSYFKEHNINVDNLKPIVKKYGLFGLNIFKIKIKGNKREYRLFNILIKRN